MQKNSERENSRELDRYMRLNYLFPYLQKSGWGRSNFGTVVERWTAGKQVEQVILHLRDYASQIFISLAQYIAEHSLKQLEHHYFYNSYDGMTMYWLYSEECLGVSVSDEGKSNY